MQLPHMCMPPGGVIMLACPHRRTAQSLSEDSRFP